MSSDLTFHNDFYSDLFITHGGLLSKKVIEDYLSLYRSQKMDKKTSLYWEKIKQYTLESLHTHDEVKERQPVLAELFRVLKLGVNIKPLSKEGDLLLRDFIVEVKQPSYLTNSSIQKTSIETNDQQLIRAMKYREKNWGLLTNSAEWQFFYRSDFDSSSLSNPFISFSIKDMINDERNSEPHICLFVNLLLNREFRQFLLKASDKNKHRATETYTNVLRLIVGNAQSLGYDESELNELVEFIFRLTFIFYCEDIGVLPRHDRSYESFDVRKKFRRSGKFDVNQIKTALKSFSLQKWSYEKKSSAGNELFWNSRLEEWLLDNAKIINQINLQDLWFDENAYELDMSEISSSDLCDVYQNCIHQKSENVGTVYTSQGLSNFINNNILNNLKLPLKDGDIILDPACGSGHLLKRLIYICEESVPVKYKHLSKSEIVSIFCSQFIAGIDKNSTAVFIAKINIWLSCVQKGKSLDPLLKFQSDDTLKRFKNAFSMKDKHLSHFLDGMGVRVKAIVSNPPWSMVHGDHPDKWIANDPFWAERKESISRQDNVAFNFAYLSHSILDKDGVGIMILPGVFFVGSSVKVRDYLIDSIFTYAPSVKNSDFKSVDPSQNFGIIAFNKAKRSDLNKIKVYSGIDSGELSSYAIDGSVFNLPRTRKKEANDLVSKFPTDTLLPLFSSVEDYNVFKQVISNSKATTIWIKGSKGKSINGDVLESKRTKKFTKQLVCSENRGNSTHPIKLIPVNVNDFANCSHKVIKLALSEYDESEAQKIYNFFNSDYFNRIVKMLRTSKSVQSAILNVVGMPNSDFASLQTHMELLEDVQGFENQIKKVKNARALRA